MRCSSRIARRSRAVTTSRASTRSGPLGDAFPTRPIWLGRIGRRPAGRRRQRPGPESAPADRRAGEVRPGPRAPRALGGHRRDGDPSPGPDRRLSARTQPGVRDATPVLKLVEGARPPPRRRADYCNSTYLAELAPDRGPLAASHPRDPQRGGPGAIRAAPRRRRRTGRASSSWPTCTPTRVTIGSSARWSVVRERLPGARATLVGDGVERPRLVELARRLGLERLRDVRRGSVARPSSSPWRARTSLRSRRRRRGSRTRSWRRWRWAGPVVARRVGGVPELVRDGEDGFLVGSEPGEMADRLVEILRGQRAPRAHGSLGAVPCRGALGLGSRRAADGRRHIGEVLRTARARLAHRGGVARRPR